MSDYAMLDDVDEFRDPVVFDLWQRIEITRGQLYSMLKPWVGRKAAKGMAYGKNRYAAWKRRTLRMALGRTNRLKEIRLLKLFGAQLHWSEQALFENNKTTYRVIE